MKLSYLYFLEERLLEIVFPLFFRVVVDARCFATLLWTVTDAGLLYRYFFFFILQDDQYELAWATTTVVDC